MTNKEEQEVVRSVFRAYINDLKAHSTKTDRPTFKILEEVKDKAIKALDQRWTPVSERLPEEHEWIGTKIFGTTISDEIYVTFETPDGQRFARHISFQNGKLSSADEQRMKTWSKGAKPIAWMPLPEPYKEEEE